jgi:two-component system, chemotaxis family, chemotaxis protein CheY
MSLEHTFISLNEFVKGAAKMVDWNPFSDESWNDDSSWGTGKARKKAPQQESPLHGFPKGKPAHVEGSTVRNAPYIDAPTQKKTPEPPPPGVKRILIIDDNIMVRRNHKIFLERLGFEVLEAVDGRNGLDKMAHYGASTFSLVLVDLNMPVMSGEEFVGAARERFGESMPPVWVCTVASDASTVKALLAKGIAGYMLKPIQFRAFATKLQCLFPDMEIRIP